MKKPISNYKSFIEPSYFFVKYHRKIRIKSSSKQLAASKDWPENWKTIYFKAYPRLREIILPKPRLPKSSLHNVLMSRHSFRNFSKEGLSSKTLSTLLYFSAGIKDIKNSKSSRFYPSGGARYPLELYVVSLKCELPQGLYHYYVKNNSLEELLIFNRFDFNLAFTKDNSRWTRKASALIIITTITNRTSDKYGENGYLMNLLEAGHIGQNISLVSSALDLGCCAITGRMYPFWEKILDIQNTHELALYIFAIGGMK